MVSIMSYGLVYVARTMNSFTATLKAFKPLRVLVSLHALYAPPHLHRQILQPPSNGQHRPLDTVIRQFRDGVMDHFDQALR